VAICDKVLLHRRVGEQLSESWFSEQFPGAWERNGRTTSAMVGEYFGRLMLPLEKQYLKQPRNRPFDYSWLAQKHANALAREHLSTGQTYTFEEDLALCLRIVERGQPGKTLPIAWFNDNVVGQVPEVQPKTPKRNVSNKSV
jgi:hypothetical protein